MHKKIRDSIERAARDGKTLYYGDIAGLADLDMSRADHRDQMGEILGDISVYEHERDRPLLSAIVIRKDLNHPGTGFYELARNLGLHKGRDDAKFFADEANRVFDYWTNPPRRSRPVKSAAKKRSKKKIAGR